MNDALPCPYCAYDLRACAGPRCPECGAPFDGAAMRAGVWRPVSPLGYDRLDPWSPLALAVHSLGLTLYLAVRPRWLLERLDLAGPVGPALRALLFGLAWVFVLATAAGAVCTWSFRDVSPFGALLFSWRELSWRSLLVGVTIGLAYLAALLDRQLLRVPRLDRRAVLRLAGYGLPASMLPGAMLIVPLRAEEWNAGMLAALLFMFLLIPAYRACHTRGALAALMAPPAAWLTARMLLGLILVWSVANLPWLRAPRLRLLDLPL